MADSQVTDNASPRTSDSEPPAWRSRWLYPILRIAFLVFVAWLIWYTAGHWDRWTGAARFESTDDAFVAGDVTPLSARVSGYITEMPVNDFQTIRKGDLIAVIDPSDYQAQLDLAQANLAAAEATLANLENQRAIQQALVREARGDDRRDRGRRAALPARGSAPAQPVQDRNRRHATAGRTGRRQREESDRATAPERSAARPAEGGAGGDRHSGKAASRPDPRGGGAGRARLGQSALYANSVARRRPRRPAASAARPIRQCRHASDRRPSAAEHLGASRTTRKPR